jgi:protocatechuate 3,4-dioxygenase beta subunit
MDRGESRSDPISRRFFVVALPAAVVAGVALLGPRLAGASRGDSRISSQMSDPTSCSSGGLTVAQTEGPYYRPNTPERVSLLEPGIIGAPLVITGRVITPDCQPVPGAWLDFWQADGQGAYDNRGFRLRGHQYTDSDGQYWLETVRPAEYPGRTPHIHVKVRAPGGPLITSQLYFPDAAANARDGIFDARLVLAIDATADVPTGRFDFVVSVS